MNKVFWFIAAIALLFAGCNESNVTPTKGNVTVEVDDAVFPVIKNEAIAFDSLYKNVKIELKKSSPIEGMVNLLNNKSKIFISTRYFNKKQSDFIDSQKLDVRIFKFCYNAVAIIGNKNNRTEQIRVDEIKDALMGKDLHYNFVLPQSSSGTFQFIKEDVLDGQDPKNVQYAKNDEEVVSKVLKNDNLLGIVSFNIIQDSSKINFLRVGQIQKTMNEDDSKNPNINYFIPHPGYVLKNYYPLRQMVYIYLFDITMTPASGFATFLTSYDGQRIALGENLAPAAVPVKINDYH